MIKILNLTRNEMVDAKKAEEFGKIQSSALITTREEKYILYKPRPTHWRDDDDYKVIEI